MSSITIAKSQSIVLNTDKITISRAEDNSLNCQLKSENLEDIVKELAELYCIQQDQIAELSKRPKFDLSTVQGREQAVIANLPPELKSC
ncbi:hypothetical protein HJ090_09910 [Vibrio parahaemolyticus]|uniref:hypothetical protein n=1 Tax=Vibrio parahaemolyticus TaxID=670 RepID=UPI000E399EC0|nr:hypothetical protein [Vibrio parahaemolyticus]MBE4202460.1 hypothetical protein [Vibrio parahaemolyticus]RFD38550.1 hypothetical protein BS585_12715 [Vibrio parahaemolyticus]